MIKAAAIVPHPPILIPNIGKENRGRLENTLRSYQKLEQILKDKNIDTIIVISSHGPVRPKIFSIGLEEKFKIDFEEFGDFSTKMEIAGDLGLAQKIREDTIGKNDAQLIASPSLDHGAGVPLYLLCYDLKDIKVVPIHTSQKDAKQHHLFGQEIAKTIQKEKKNIAVVASGDLSHCLNEKAPAGYSPKGAKFDQKIIENLKDRKTREIMEIDHNTLKEVKACGPRSIAVLLGILSKLDYESDILSYEYPFGIGNLTAYFDIKTTQVSSSRPHRSL